MRKGSLIILALLVALVAGCGGGSGSSSSTTAAKPFRVPIKTSPPIVYEKEILAKEKSNGLVGSEPKLVKPEGTPPPNVIAERDIIEGIGHLSGPESKVTIQYVAFDYKTGKKLGESSWDQGKPLTFTIGKGEVMKGLEQGVEGMEVADRREMVIPPDLNTGPEVPAGIPQNTQVIIVADMLRVQEQPKEETSSKTESSGKEPKVTVPKGPPPKKLVEKELKTGKGPSAKAGDTLRIQYVGVDYETGKQFASSWDSNEALTFELGAGEVIEGWDQGIEGMKAGGQRELIVPPSLASGPGGFAQKVNPNATLVFVIELLSVK